MPVTIKSNQINVKNDGSYMSLDALSDNTTAQRVQEINSAASSAQSAITAKKADALASIPEVSELENMIAEVFSTSKAYSVGDYVIQEVNGINKLYKFNKEHSAGAWNIAHVTEVKTNNEISQSENKIKNELLNANAIDIFPMLNHSSYSHNGVTFTWSKDKTTCTVEGTTSSIIAVNGLYANENGFPIGMKAGEKYRVKYNSIDVPFQVYAYIDGSFEGNLVRSLKTNGDFVIPSNATGIVIRLAVGVNKTVNETILSPKIFTETFTNEELTSNIKELINDVEGFEDLVDNTVHLDEQTLTSAQKEQARNNINAADAGVTYFTQGWVEANTDIDTLTENGVYLIGVGEYPHAPFSGKATLIEVHKATDNVIVQNATCVATNETKHRISTSGNFGDWKGGELFPKDIIADNTDLDDIKDQGIWILNSGRAYTHSPISSVHGGTMLVFYYNANNILQILIEAGTNVMFARQSVLGTFPQTWTSYYSSHGFVAADTDIDTLTDNGAYLLGVGNYTHAPFPGRAALIEVHKATDNVIVQNATCVATNETKHRISTSGNFGDWKENEVNQITNNFNTQHYDNTYTINCTPTITTDTNNYLAATGDTTDRTGDIQTMLNTTGVCHLGPGDFYITGVDVPNYGALIGSGKKTKLILVSSVETGYAVRLRTYSTIKDMYLLGDSTNTYKPVDKTDTDVGTRHGILFEGTANAQTGAQTYYNSYVTGCVIRCFSGGGITCVDTGLSPSSSLVISDCQISNCDVGINIPFFSEFHRISNVTANGCYYGCVCNGGNNNFSCCDFSSNKISLLIDNSSGTMRNNTHGTFSACSFHHSDNVYNDQHVILSNGVGIKIIGAQWGEVFSGCQVGYSDIDIENSTAIRFVGCNILRGVALKVVNSRTIIFSDCTFYDNTTSPLTQSGNTTLKFNECYMLNGTKFDPMS